MVSIIVPIYNLEKYLDRCVKSLVEQSYTDIEIYLVNDGSTDTSADICNNWAKLDKRIKVIHTVNEGPSSARNRGLDKAQGEYVMFVDGDDYVDKDYVRCLYEEASTQNQDIVMCNYYYVNEDGIRIYPSNYTCISSTESISNVMTLRYFEDQKYGTFFDVVWNKIYRMTLFSSIRFPEGITLVEDAYLLPKVYHLANRISIKSDKLYYYVNRNNSITRGTFTKSEDYNYRKPMMEERTKDYIMWGIKDLILNQYIHLYTLIAQQDIYSNSELRDIQKQYRYYYTKGKYIDKVPLMRKIKFFIAACSMPAYQFLVKQNIKK